jgi:hypothetical protein
MAVTDGAYGQALNIGGMEPVSLLELRPALPGACRSGRNG